MQLNLFWKSKRGISPIKALLVDVGYSDQLIDWVNSICGWILEIVKRNDNIKFFQVLLHRWVVSALLDGWEDNDV
jgi:hypothetical protein